MSDHTNKIVVNVSLSPLPAARAGFGRVMMMRDGITLFGNRTKVYSTVEEAQTDLTGGDIDAATFAAIEDAFSQTTNRPTDIMVGRVNTGLPETYSAAFALIEAENPDFYGVTLDVRDGTIASPIASLIEASSTNRLLFLQDDDAGWLTTGVPAAYSFISTLERTSLIYHDDDTDNADVAWACSRLAHDPDNRSSPFVGALDAVDALSPLPTATERDFVIANNANIGLAYGSETVFVFDGVNGSGRPVDHQLTADWFAARLSERMQDLMVAYAAAGQKLIIDPTGQAVVLAECEAQLAAGVAAEHFVVGETRAVAEAITAADRTAQRMRFTIEAQLTTNAVTLTFNVNFSLNPISTS